MQSAYLTNSSQGPCAFVPQNAVRLWNILGKCPADQSIFITYSNDKKWKNR